jgi:hypothetical protein
MNQKKITIFIMTAGVLLVLGSLLLLGTKTASAQCGSQASSCKNCHEVQAKDPVNTDGTDWHLQHAFGDFCYLCHAGNNQATSETQAHTGMVSPMQDYVASCKGCHPDDFESLAQGYATTLGVTLGAISNTSTLGISTSATGTEIAPPPAQVQAAAIPAADMVDYSQRYDETVLGKKPVNVGNIILIMIIAAILFGGGYFVFRRENLLKVSFQETKQIQGSYPSDVVDLVPAIARLKPSARKDLQQLLSKPSKAAEALALMTKMMGKNDASRDAEKKEGK